MRLLLALAASLLLHLLPGLLDWGPGQWGNAPPTVGRAVFVVSLAGRSEQDAAPLAIDTAAGKEDRQASSAAADSSPPVAPAEPPPPASEIAVTLGHQRLAAYLPPYLARADTLNVPDGAWYFPASELTVPPRLVDALSLDAVEPEAREEALRGRLVLRVYLARDGKVDRVEVAASTLPATLQEAVAAAVSKARFRPGEIQGVAVTSSTRFEINLDASDGGASHLTDRQYLRTTRPH